MGRVLRNRRMGIRELLYSIFRSFLPHYNCKCVAADTGPSFPRRETGRLSMSLLSSPTCTSSVRLFYSALPKPIFMQRVLTLSD